MRHPLTTKAALVGAALTVALVTTSCGGGDVQPQAEPTITLAQANELVDQHIQQATTQLSPQAQLDLLDKSESYPCDDPTDGGSPKRRSAQRSYQVKGLDKEQIPSYFETLRTWWPKAGYRILKDEPKNKYLWVENTHDSFRISLEANDLSEVYINASSPCVWPNGTPEPAE